MLLNHATDALVATPDTLWDLINHITIITNANAVNNNKTQITL